MASTPATFVRCRWCAPPCARRRLGRASLASLARFAMEGAGRAAPGGGRRLRTTMDDPGGVRALLAKLREQQDRVAAPAAPVCGPPRRPWDRARLAQAAPAASLRTLPYALAVERIYELARDPAFAAQIQQVRRATDAAL